MRTKIFTACFLCWIVSLIVSFNAIATIPGEPYTATDPFGNSVVVWHEGRCRVDVYAQCYDSAKNPVGDKLWVSDNTLHWNHTPLAATNNLQNFIVVWNGCVVDFGSPGSYWVDTEVYARLFFSSGESSEIFQISYAGTGCCENRCPEASAVGVAMAPSGKIIICWEEYEVIFLPPWGAAYGPTADLYCQQFGPTGSPLTNPCRINDLPVDCLDFLGLDVTEEKITVSYKKMNDKQIEKVNFEWSSGVEPKITIEKQSDLGEVFQLTLSPTTPTKKYQVFYCDNLFCEWLKLGEPIEAKGTRVMVADDGNAIAPNLSQVKSRFYRVEWLP